MSATGDFPTKLTEDVQPSPCSSLRCHAPLKLYPAWTATDDAAPLFLPAEGGIPRRAPSPAGCWGKKRRYVCAVIPATAKVRVSQPRSRKVCSPSLSITLSLPSFLRPSLLPPLGGVTTEDRPPQLRQAATQRERMARRAPTGICGTVQSVAVHGAVLVSHE